MTPQKPERRTALRQMIRTTYESQADFAFVVGAHQGTVSRVINGRQDLPLETQEHWARWLGCKREEIFPDEPAGEQAA
jgi:transcriptional regulator with XRE-family HTH domain